ncbi:hypothetical protein [Crassaminicella profunda]|nr:hypothetical protein [Crassaminicella profunda]
MGIAIEDKGYSYDEYLKIVESEEDTNKRYILIRNKHRVYI